MLCIPLKHYINTSDDTTLVDIFRWIGPVELGNSRHSFDKIEIGLLIIGLFILFQLFLFGTVFFVIFIKQQFPSKRLNRLFRGTIVLNFYVLFFPVHSFLVQSIERASRQESLLKVLDKQPFTILSVLLIVLNFLFSSIGTFTYSHIRNKDFFAKKNSNICGLTFLYKVIVPILLQCFDRDTAIKWVLVLLTGFYIILICYFFEVQLIFYNLRTVKLFALIEGNLVSCGLVIIATAIWDETTRMSVQLSVLVIWSLLLPYMALKSRWRLRQMLLDSLKLTSVNFKTETDHFRRMLALKWIFNEGCKTSWKSKKKDNNPLQLTMFGILRNHMVNCVREECHCKQIVINHAGYKNEDGDFSVNKLYMNEVIHTITMEYLKEGANQLKKENIFFDLAYFYLVKDDKFLLSYLTLRQLRSKKSKGYNIGRTTSTKLLEKMIEVTVKSKCGNSGSNKENLKIYELIKHNELSEEIKALMASQTQKQLSLWEFFNQSKWSATELFDKAKDIETTRLKIEQIWIEISNHDHKDIMIFLLYGLYSSIINNNFMKSEKLLKKIDVMNTIAINNTEFSLTNQTLYDTKNVLVSMSMDRERLGKVEACSRNIYETFGFKPQEVVGSNINMLMPNFLRKRHQSILLKYLTTTKESLFNNQRRSFGYTKKGHIFPLNIYLSVYPSLKNGLLYFGILRPINEFREYILLTNNGYIDGCTEIIASQLSLNLLKNKTHISDVCPELGRINGAFAFLFLQQLSEKFFTKQFDTKKSKKTEGDEDIDIIRDISWLKGENLHTSILDKGEKTNNFLLEHALDSPQRTVPMETIGLETTFRAVTTMENGAPDLKDLKRNSMPAFKKLQMMDSEENKVLYERFTLSGDVVEFYNSEKNKHYTYHVQIHEEVFGESVLRVLKLSHSYKQNSYGDFEADEAAERQLNPMYSTSRAISVNDKDIISIKPQLTENEEDSLLFNINIPNERTETVNNTLTGQVVYFKSGDNSPKSKFHYDGGSVTSRFNQTEYPSQLLKFHYDGGSATSRFQGEGGASITSRFKDYQVINEKEKSKDLLLPNGQKQGSDNFLNSFSRIQTLDKTRTQLMPQDNLGSNELNSKSFSLKRSAQMMPAETSGTQKPSKENAFVNTDPIKKFFKQHRTHIKKDFENSSNAGTSSSASSNRIFGAVERAFGELSKLNKYNYWFWLGVMICFAAFILLVVYFVIIKIELLKVMEDSQSLFHVGRRIDAFLELTRNNLILDLHLQNYITADRHEKDGVADYITYVHDELKNHVLTLNKENNILMEYVSDLSGILQHELYDDINGIKIVDTATGEITIRDLVTFDAVTKVVLFGTEIMSTPVNELASKQARITSVIENSFSELYPNLSEPYDIYAKKIDDDFGIMDNYFIICLGVGILGFVGFFIYSYLELKQLFRDTQRFWEALLRFELKKAEEHKAELKILLTGFQQNQSFNELFAEVNKVKEGDHPSVYSAIHKNGKSKEVFGFLKKSHDWRSSRTFLPTFIPLALIFIAFVVTLSASKILLSIQANMRNNFVEDLKIVFDAYHLQTETTALLYQYIRTDGLYTVRSESIDTALTNSIREISNINQFITDYKEQQDEGTVQLIQEDLCKSIFANRNQTLCYLLADGANSKGLAGIVSYLAHSISFAKEFFDLNQASATVIEDTLNLKNIKEIEMEFSFINIVFKQVEDNLHEDDTEEQNSFSTWFFVIVIIILIIECLIWIMLFRRAYSQLKIHKTHHTLVLKNIPVTLIWESKLIRTYIFTLFKGSVQSVKYSG